ncbi:unnamed protein product [Phytophthora fragariaefolia]|uniref:Unnamed protein product n=1 Tax=Phytophthora fragariaefolia TaxID=1490495 RepID=A0A9W6TYA7_9STRA|nr:unnamed protein product [Phytophthora fragariaefolia]
MARTPRPTASPLWKVPVTSKASDDDEDYTPRVVDEEDEEDADKEADENEEPTPSKTKGKSKTSSIYRFPKPTKPRKPTAAQLAKDIVKIARRLSAQILLRPNPVTTSAQTPTNGEVPMIRDPLNLVSPCVPVGGLDPLSQGSEDAVHRV